MMNYFQESAFMFNLRPCHTAEAMAGAERTLASLGVHTGGDDPAAAASAATGVASKPHLVNLSEDPAMMGRVVYALKQGRAPPLVPP